VSYSLSVNAAKAEIREAVEKAVDDYMPTVEATEWQPTDEVREHLAAAVNAVARLADAVGQVSDTLAVSINGHANPGHAPAEGWADELVSVAVHRVRT
jgi:hypothetical protein